MYANENEMSKLFEREDLWSEKRRVDLQSAKAIWIEQ